MKFIVKLILGSTVLLAIAVLALIGYIEFKIDSYSMGDCEDPDNWGV